MKKRVVITGMGVVSPNGIGLADFGHALSEGVSGLRYIPKLAELNFSCQVGGVPQIDAGLLEKYFTGLELKRFDSNGIAFGVIAGMDALFDAGITPASSDAPPYEDLGVLFGTGVSGVEKFRESVELLDQGKVKRLGSTTVGQIMASGISAYLGGKIGAGNMVTTNSSACATGTEAILMGYHHIAEGRAEKMLCGSCSGDSPYIWGGFDAMRITSWKYNDAPERSSRPMSASASGIVPGSGAGALMLESLESATRRGARIYAEVLGGAVNNGGQRMGGSMTAPNSMAVKRCIRMALKHSAVESRDIDTINGHLTATNHDLLEIENWSEALQLSGKDFPPINSLKGLIGHGLAACGSIEAVATVLQLQKNFIFGNNNCEDLHPGIQKLIGRDKVPENTIFSPLKTAITASFGFGDVNACVIFSKN